MAKPSEKSPKMEKVLDDLTKKIFNKSRTETIKTNQCMTCNKPATGFRDDISRKEYTISGMCQDCQDELRRNRT